MASLASSAPQGDAPIGTILHRKAQAGRAEHQSRAMSLAKALRLTLAKVADEQLEMSMAAISVRSQRCPSDAIDEHLKATDLLLLLDGPARSRAAAMIDPALVGSLIQQQTMGTVLPEVTPSERPMTPTDAAIVAPFLNALLERAAPVPEDPTEQKLIAGFSFGAWVEDPRVLAMAMDAPDYELIHIDVDISGGVRQGRILLCMPVGQGGGADMPLPDTQDDDDIIVDAGTPSIGLSDTVMKLAADLRVSLAQLRMPLRDLGKLEVGSLLDLDKANFAMVRVQSLDGRAVGRGTLGQLEGMRAVQVVSTASDKPALRRRASDRDGLNLPDITAEQADHMNQRQSDVLQEQSGMSDLPELPDLPDMSGDAGMESPNGMPELTDLPDLPDMSDLPDFDDELELPNMSAG